ncbi:MAG: hypothetical protein HQL51_02905 [Magnetococcales bacterium]|nr:hypothetical protein [Magnetococcales bacterium]
MTTLTIPDALAEPLKILAERQRETLEELVREILRRHLEDREEVEEAEEARLALAAFRRDPSGAVSMDDMLKEAGFTREELQ